MEGDDALSCVVSELATLRAERLGTNEHFGWSSAFVPALFGDHPKCVDGCAHVNWLSNHQFSVQLHSRYFRMAQEMFTDGLIGALACVRHAPTPWATDLCVQMRTTWPNLAKLRNTPSPSVR
jgi:hypothetical protein